MHDSSRSIRTIFCSLVQLQTVRGTAHFQDRPTAKKILTVVIYFSISLQHCPNSPFRPYIWLQHRLNLGHLWPTHDLASTWVQLGSNMVQLGCKVDLFGGNFGPSWAPRGLSITDMASAASPTPNRLGVDEAARRAMPPPRLAQLGAKLPPNCSKLRHAIWAQAGPNRAQWVSARAQAGPSDTLKSSVLIAISNVLKLRWGLVL